MRVSLMLFHEWCRVKSVRKDEKDTIIPQVLEESLQKDLHKYREEYFVQTQEQKRQILSQSSIVLHCTHCILRCDCQLLYIRFGWLVWLQVLSICVIFVITVNFKTQIHVIQNPSVDQTKHQLWFPSSTNKIDIQTNRSSFT